jgi:hypothetical protein
MKITRLLFSIIIQYYLDLGVFKIQIGIKLFGILTCGREIWNLQFSRELKGWRTFENWIGFFFRLFVRWSKVVSLSDYKSRWWVCEFVGIYILIGILMGIFQINNRFRTKTKKNSRNFKLRDFSWFLNLLV